jgi:hypothetical protein
MPKSVLTSRYQLVDDNDKYLREERQQPNEPIITSQPVGTGSSSSTASTCSTNSTSTSPSGSRACPESGRICNYAICPNECLGDKDGFSDNLEYTGISTPKGKNAVSGWPCVVVGAISQTWVSTAERILRTTVGEWDTKQHTDAGLNNDGPAATTKL